MRIFFHVVKKTAAGDAHAKHLDNHHMFILTLPSFTFLVTILSRSEKKIF